MKEIINTASGKPITQNPWAKRTFNLTDAMFLEKNSPGLAAQMKADAARIDAENFRQTHTRTVAEFNQLDTAGKIQFIKSGGEVTA